MNKRKQLKNKMLELNAFMDTHFFTILIDLKLIYYIK